MNEIERLEYITEEKYSGGFKVKKWHGSHYKYQIKTFERIDDDTLKRFVDILYSTFNMEFSDYGSGDIRISDIGTLMDITGDDAFKVFVLCN